MATIPEAFAMAQRHHRTGRLAEAERMYRQVLAINPRPTGSLQPDSAEARLNLGTIRVDRVDRASHAKLAIANSRSSAIPTAIG
jgi:hypothetical protein